MTHIGLNMVFVIPGDTGGIEVYARELLPALRRVAPDLKFTAFISRTAANKGLDFIDNDVHRVVLPVHPRTRSGWVPGEIRLLPRLAEQAGCDLVHSLASTGPLHGRFARIGTVHDLIYRALPRYHRRLRFLGPRLLVSRLLIPFAARHAHRVIADSHATAADIFRFLNLPPDKVDIIPLGPGQVRRTDPTPEQALRKTYHLGSRPFVLSVSAFWPHKNLPRLIRALALIPREERPLLILPGYPTYQRAQLERRARRLGVAHDIRFPGWVPASDLEGLYAAAACCVQPSLYEGFGLPALEAMSRGVPLACSQTGVLGEVAGGAALTFDPLDANAIARTIRRLLDDPRQARQTAEAGATRAAQYSWDRTARLTLQTYTRALSPPHPE